MKAHLLNWIRTYTSWIIIVLLAVGIFVALIGTTVGLPLTLIIAAAAFALFRYWHAIRTFESRTFNEWFHTRLNAIGVREWHAPYRAAELYCNPAMVKVRNDAAMEMNSIMMELIRTQSNTEGPAETSSPGTEHALKSAPEPDSSAQRRNSYDTAQIRHNQCNAALASELIVQLARGGLMAKGLPIQDHVAQSEHMIPASHWQGMNFDIAKAEASGNGLKYTGIVIGQKTAFGKKSASPVTRS